MQQEPKTPRERAEDLIRLLVPDWRPTEAQVLWTIRIVIVLCGLGFIGAGFNIPLVAVAQLLLGAAIPIAIALVGNRFTQQRTQDDAFQSYLNQMGELMLDKDSPLSSVEADDPLLTLARARTAAVVQRLDAEGTRSVVRFLHEAGLLGNVKRSISVLSGVDLRNAALDHADLRGINLSYANLSYANLRGAYLLNADLSYADLSYANLSDAYLKEADLREARLTDADLRGADLIDAKLVGAYLVGANMTRARLRPANLEGAYLSGRLASDLETGQTTYVDAATMPNGQKFDDWLKSGDREEDGQNGGSR